ncbi:MAG: conjugal transfer protein TraK [Bacteroidota bacterium]
MEAFTDIAKRYNALVLLCITSFVCLMGSNALWAWRYLAREAAQHERVYVVSQGGTYPAQLSRPDETTIFEARNHVAAFMQLMFAHDELSYADHIERALHMIEKAEGAAIFADFQKGGVHDNYIKYGSRSVFELDSIRLDMNQEPYLGEVYGRQRVIYQDEERALPVGASFQLIRQPRNAHNPHGLLIQHWRFVLYQNEFAPQATDR